MALHDNGGMLPTPPSNPVRHLSKATIKPPSRVKEGPNLWYLTPGDLAMLSSNYIQKGHLFSIPPSSEIRNHAVDRLKASLSVALHHFFPLAGRLVTVRDADKYGMFVNIDCNDHGADFIHAVAENVSVADVVAPGKDLPSFMRHFFHLDGAVNIDGHDVPLLGVQVTELVDGIFVGYSFNHAVGDGSSFWHFLSAWAEICKAEMGAEGVISRPPILDRWFADLAEPPIKLPFSHNDEFITRYSPPTLRERMFHFAPDSIAKLKTQANREANTNKISSFQALCALVWRSIARARGVSSDQKTIFRLAIENRSRIRPPLSPNYFGNAIYAVDPKTTARELLSHELGWAAELVHQAVASHTDEVILGALKCWLAAPMVYPPSILDGCSIMMGSSPRFDMYACDFGWGKAVAVRSGSANKFDAKVMAYPGREGGSVELEVCLLPEVMSAIESDNEFMNAVSPSPAPADIYS